MSSGTPRTPKEKPDWKPAWLEAFQATGMVTEACRTAGAGRTTVYMARRTDEAFAQAWQDIEEKTTERMEREALRRGVEGWDSKFELNKETGEVVATEHKFSDTLLIFMLKARRPEVYRDNVHIQHGGEVAQHISASVVLDGDLARDARAILRRAATPRIS